MYSTITQPLKSNVVFDATKNQKQKQYLDAILKALSDPVFRYYFFGGAVRGGKTSVNLIALILLAKMFPKSRWHIIRESMSTHEDTTIPSFEKFCPESSRIVKKYNRDKGNFFVEFIMGSKIFFASENIKQDPELNWMKGLETNGIFLEQMEELNHKTYEKALERTGSWYIDPMPPGYIFGTFNPTQTWVKETIYDKWQKGELKAPFYFQEALPKDNPFVTEQQWEAWEQMDATSYSRFIEGDWSAFSVDKPFMYCFEDSHIQECEYRQGLPVYIAFDFNVDPCTALIWQEGFVEGKEWIHYIDEVYLFNSNIYEVCDKIKVGYPNAHYMITGDATGRSRSALTKGRTNYYIVIKQELEIKDAQIKLPSVNPPIDNSRVLCNSILSHHKGLKISPRLKELIKDLKYVEVNEEGQINKTKNKHRSHLLDDFRYSLNTFHHNFLKNV